MHRQLATLLPAVALIIFSCGSLRAADKPTDSAAAEFFEKKVRPVLVEHCYRCHSSEAKKLKAGLLLDSREGLLKGGDNGPALVPGQSEKSRLIEAVRYKNVDMQMPPTGKLADTVIADLAAWVKMGAPWPGKASVATVKNNFDLERRKREHWAWQPIRSPAPPTVTDKSWAKTPIDQFILAKLEAKKLRPAAPADRRTLIRRVYFDLIGLPPTSEEVEAFVRDSDPDALAKVVDRLLASSQFGERWARHWLDLVRYGETRGHEFDYIAPNAYQYRDYLIRALNADVPYNQFVLEHVAGDLLEKPRLHPKERFNESILGTGFWFLGEEVHSPVDVRQDQAERFDNRIDVLTKTFLGLTVACARCHDHKFDAISTRDYYALYGFLESSSYRQVRFDTLEENRRLATELTERRERARAALGKDLAKALQPEVDRLADYLLASREAIAAGPEFLAESKRFTDAYRHKLEEIARPRKLAADALADWVLAVLHAARDERSPLHPWAKICLAGKDTSTANTLRPLAQNWRTRLDAAGTALREASVVVDYRKSTPKEWLEDGVAFGLRPARAGEVRIGDDDVRLIEQDGAERDPVWDRQKLAPESQFESGSVGSIVHAGRTLRTPTFTLNPGKLYYLMRGKGRAYAAVDQHILINGPLHSRLVQSIRTDKLQWIEHDLTAYQGRSTHIEFTPADDADFAVVMVVQSAQAPGSLDLPNSALAQLLASDSTRSGEALAAGYQKVVAAALERLARDRLVGTEGASAQVQLLNTLLQLPYQQRGLREATAGFRTEQAKVISQIKPQTRIALAILDGNALDERVFIRGSPKALGPVVPRRFLEALTGPQAIETPGSGRLELARRMVDPNINPFITRVLVNRVWHHLFGRGIVPSVDNFGVLGEAPTHPELLDYLAQSFADEGWSTKKLIRTLVLTRSYQMSSAVSPEASRELQAVDPKNELLHCMRVRRLEGEALRDALLGISGRLNGDMYGPPVPVYLTEFQDGRGRPASGPLDGAGRRSIYLSVRRNFLSPFLLAFDLPIPFSTMGRRTVSNVPAQALILMNDPFVHQQSELWAKRVLAKPGTTPERITRMYASAFSRPPTEAELKQCSAFLAAQGKLYEDGADSVAAWKDLAHVLFNVKEFIFLN
jgi:hypothetical protein